MAKMSPKARKQRTDQIIEILEIILDALRGTQDPPKPAAKPGEPRPGGGASGRSPGSEWRGK